MVDFFAQLEFWQEIPPPNISMAMIARAHGAKFGDGQSSTGSPPSGPIENADPVALQAMFGQSEPVPYRAPQRGLSLGDQTQGDG